ncbi:MAG: AMIN domain-containing protein [Candidatus Aminicenantales bacterium]
MRQIKLAGMVLLLAFIAPYLVRAQGTAENHLEDVKITKSENRVEALIVTTGEISYESFSLMNPNRLVLDFFSITQVSTPPLLEVNHLGVVNIRSAPNRPGVARVVFTFTEEAPLFKIEDVESGVLVILWKEPVLKKEPAVRTEPIQPPESKKAKTPEKKKPEPKPETAKPPKPQEIRRPVIPPSQGEREREMKQVSIGFSSGYLAFQDEVFQTVYGNGGAFFKGEYAFLLPIDVKNLDVWTCVMYFRKDGKTSYTQEATQLEITTFSLALRYLRKFSRFEPFVGAGIDYVVYEETLPEGFTPASIGGSDLGFHAQAGTYIEILPYLAGKLQVKYNWAKTLEDGVEVNLGGIEYGIGLIFRFNL